MRAALWIIPVVLFGAGCAASADGSNEGSPPAASGSAPAGFETWLSEQCPDNALVSVRNTETSELVATVTCERLRDEVHANAVMWDRLVEAYVMATEKPVDPIGGERLGEAKEPWSPLGLICDIIFAVMTGYGCHRSHLDWRACLGVSSAPMVACNLL